MNSGATVGRGTLSAYERGFVTKCAELGVDPDLLLKRAGLNLEALRRMYSVLGSAFRNIGRGFVRTAPLPPAAKNGLMYRMMPIAERIRRGLPPRKGMVRVPGSGGHQWQFLPDNFGERLARGGTVSKAPSTQSLLASADNINPTMRDSLPPIGTLDKFDQAARIKRILRAQKGLDGMYPPFRNGDLDGFTENDLGLLSRLAELQ